MPNSGRSTKWTQSNPIRKIKKKKLPILPLEYVALVKGRFT
jgi:hypothetical protein